eukprot:3456613-Pleurochrysis_carterae.AAC.1
MRGCKQRQRRIRNEQLSTFAERAQHDQEEPTGRAETEIEAAANGEGGERSRGKRKQKLLNEPIDESAGEPQTDPKAEMSADA